MVLCKRSAPSPPLHFIKRLHSGPQRPFVTGQRQGHLSGSFCECGGMQGGTEGGGAEMQKPPE